MFVVNLFSDVIFHVLMKASYFERGSKDILFKCCLMLRMELGLHILISLKSYRGSRLRHQKFAQDQKILSLKRGFKSNI